LVEGKISKKHQERVAEGGPNDSRIPKVELGRFNELKKRGACWGENPDQRSKNAEDEMPQRGNKVRGYNRNEEAKKLGGRNIKSQMIAIKPNYDGSWGREEKMRPKCVSKQTYLGSGKSHQTKRSAGKMSNHSAWHERELT